ncbi:DMT family transporter [Shimia biformata]|uniref:DMT family transporter n=1 Tax=Shimia biformata TaxID=1294299 RepID=UPI0019523FA2|nr:DMT family transporter [Shimia biformata]
MSDEAHITRRDWLMVATLGLVWGSTFMVIELALRGITPFWLAAGRIGFAALLMVVFWWMRGFALWKDPSRRDGRVPLIITGALSSAVPFMLISWGQQYVTSGFTGVSMASVALMVLPLAYIFLPEETMSLRKVMGFLVGFAGVAVLMGAQAFESSGSELEWAGRITILLATACYASSSVMMRRLPPMDTIGLATVQLLIGSCIVLPAAYIVEGPPPPVAWDILLIIVVLGMVPTAAANLLRVMVIRSAGPTFMSLTNYQVPIWSMVLGALILGEPLPPSLFWALALILTGVCLSQYGALKRLFGKS